MLTVEQRTSFCAIPARLKNAVTTWTLLSSPEAKDFSSCSGEVSVILDSSGLSNCDGSLDVFKGSSDELGTLGIAGSIRSIDLSRRDCARAATSCQGTLTIFADVKEPSE